MKLMNLACGLAVAAVTLSMAAPALAEFPERDITIVMPFPPGGALILSSVRLASR
jgi:tripartite-type tricarboxylate transporter receptor subunit TctC